MTIILVFGFPRPRLIMDGVAYLRKTGTIPNCPISFLSARPSPVLPLLTTSQPVSQFEPSHIPYSPSIDISLLLTRHPPQLMLLWL